MYYNVCVQEPIVKIKDCYRAELRGTTTPQLSCIGSSYCPGVRSRGSHITPPSSCYTYWVEAVLLYWNYIRLEAFHHSKGTLPCGIYSPETFINANSVGKRFHNFGLGDARASAKVASKHKQLSSRSRSSICLRAPTFSKKGSNITTIRWQYWKL